jgi:hypothetical protein
MITGISIDKKGLIEGYEGLFPDFGIDTTDGTDITLRQVPESRPWGYAPFWLSALRVIDIPTGHTEIPACPFCQEQERSRSRSADGAGVVCRQFFKGDPGWNLLPGLPSHRVVDVTTNSTSIWLRALWHCDLLEEKTYRLRRYSAR